MEKLVVVHPAIQPVEVWISYVAYEGWIYTGRFQWSLDKLLLTDSFGSKSSFCEAGGRLLPSGKAIVVPLSSGDCAAATRYPIAPYHKVGVLTFSHGTHDQYIDTSVGFLPQSQKIIFIFLVSWKASSFSTTAHSTSKQKYAQPE